MSRKKPTVPRYRRLRTDRRHHHKLEGISVLTRDIWEMAVDASPLGVLQASVQKIATECGPLTPGGRPPTRREVQAAIAELEGRQDARGPWVRWWPALEVLWIREAADEQVMNDSMWLGLREEWLTLPAPVREAIADRYPRLTTVAPHSAGTQCAPTVTPHPSVQDQEQEQKQDQITPLPPETGGTDAGRSRPGNTLRDRSRGREADADLVAKANAVLDRLNERRAWIAKKYQLPGVQQFRHAKGNRTEITRVLAEGEPLERLLLVVDAAAREVAQRRGEGLEWLTPITPFRASNWPRYLGKIGAPKGGANGGGAAKPDLGRGEISIGLRDAEIRRREREREAALFGAGPDAEGST